MKKQFYIGFLLVISSTFTNNLFAKIWRVNNGTGITANFTTAQAAHDGAAAGDTIHFEPSLNGYGNISMSKRLTLISTGLFSTSNPNLQADPKHGSVANITISNSGANGSVISVLFTDGIDINNGVSNITIVNSIGTGPLDNNFCCGRPYISINNADNITVSKSMFSLMAFTSNSNNIVVTNNIIWFYIGNDITSDGIINNNVIRAGNPNDATGLNNCVVANNIFNKSINTSFTNCNLSNKFAPGTGAGSCG